MKKYIVYYTDNKLEESLDVAARAQLQSACGDIPIISVSQIPMNFGTNICVGRKPRSYTSLHEQLVIGLKATEEGSIIYVTDHDVFYHPHHFNFIPPTDKKIYFNLHRFYFKLGIKTFLPSTGKRAHSQAVGYREPLIEFYGRVLEQRLNDKVCYMHGPFANWRSESPNIDIRHGGNMTSSTVKRGWTYGDAHENAVSEVKGWGTTADFQKTVGYHNWNVGTKDYFEKLFEPTEFPFFIPKFFRGNLEQIFKALHFTSGAVIGVGSGRHVAFMSHTNPFLDLICVDPYDPYTNRLGESISWDAVETSYKDCRNALRLHPNTQIIRKTSIQVANVTPKSSLDFVYLGGAYDFNNVSRDIIMWTDRVRPGGIVSGNNYDHPDVKLAVDAYTKAHDIEYYVTDNGNESPDCFPSWFFAKGDL